MLIFSCLLLFESKFTQSYTAKIEWYLLRYLFSLCLNRTRSGISTLNAVLLLQTWRLNNLIVDRLVHSGVFSPSSAEASAVSSLPALDPSFSFRRLIPNFSKRSANCSLFILLKESVSSTTFL